MSKTTATTTRSAALAVVLLASVTMPSFGIDTAPVAGAPQSSQAPGTATELVTSPTPPGPSSQAATACHSRPAETFALPGDHPFADANAKFALALLSGLSANNPTNTSVSPLGVAAVLAGLDLGADQTMRDAILKTLRAGSKATSDGQGLLSAVRSDQRYLTAIADKEDGALALANGLFVDMSVILRPGISDFLSAESRIDVRSVSFASAKGVDDVNMFVARNTRNRITSILDPGSTPTLVAVNAFSFKDCWRFKFDPSRTAPKSFHRADGSAADRPTMQMENIELGYFTNGHMIAIELPYADERFTLTMVKLDTAMKLADMLRGKDIELALTAAKFKPTLIDGALPRFTGTGSHDLLSILGSLGLDKGLASKSQLSGFADGLGLSQVVQRTFIKADETGTEAAAATAAIVSRALVQTPARPVVAFDTPFVYALRHRLTGTILMLGYIGDPGAATN